MKDLIASKVSGLYREADVVKEGFVEKGQFLRDCAKEQGVPLQIVTRAYSQLLKEGEIEEVNAKEAGYEGLRKQKTFAKQVSTKGKTL